MRVFWGVPLALLALSACGVNQQITPTMGTVCEVPRPQVCTMEYAPVCGVLIAGGERDFSSDCNACANDAVASYRTDPCSSEEK